MKTLIILDTNKIRSMSLGGASYGSFEFGSEFDSLNTLVADEATRSPKSSTGSSIAPPSGTASLT